MFAEDRLELIDRRHRKISDKLASGPDSKTFVQLSRELAELDEVVGKIARLAQRPRGTLRRRGDA